MIALRPRPPGSACAGPDAPPRKAKVRSRTAVCRPLRPAWLTHRLADPAVRRCPRDDSSSSAGTAASATALASAHVGKAGARLLANGRCLPSAGETPASLRSRTNRSAARVATGVCRQPMAPSLCQAIARATAAAPGAVWFARLVRGATPTWLWARARVHSAAILSLNAPFAHRGRSRCSHHAVTTERSDSARRTKTLSRPCPGRSRTRRARRLRGRRTECTESVGEFATNDERHEGILGAVMHLNRRRQPGRRNQHE
jgi:hypothetical protein